MADNVRRVVCRAGAAAPCPYVMQPCAPKCMGGICLRSLHTCCSPNWQPLMYYLNSSLCGLSVEYVAAMLTHGKTWLA